MTIGMILGAYQVVTRTADGHQAVFRAIVQPRGDGPPIQVETSAAVPESVPVGIQSIGGWHGLFLVGCVLERKETSEGAFERFAVRVSGSNQGDSPSVLESPWWTIKAKQSKPSMQPA